MSSDRTTSLKLRPQQVPHSARSLGGKRGVGQQLALAKPRTKAMQARHVAWHTGSRIPWNPTKVVDSGRWLQLRLFETLGCGEHASRSSVTIGAAQQPSPECGCPAGGWLNQSTVGCPTSSAQGQNPSATSHLKPANSTYDKQTKIASLRRYSPNLVAKNQGAASCLTTKTGYFRGPQNGVSTKTGRAARGLPSSQECDVGCSNQVTAKQKGDTRSQPCL